MVNSGQPQVSFQDDWVEHPHGKLFVRSWRFDCQCGVDEAVPIILLHDSLGSVELWRDFPELICLQTQRPVIAYDRLGFGRSDPRQGIPDTNFVAQEAQEYLPKILEHFQLKHFIVLGHSVGGGMAVNCAAHFNGRCHGLITIAAQAFPEAQTLDGIREAKQYFQNPRRFSRLEKYHGDKARWVLDAWTQRWLDPEFTDWTLEPILPLVNCPLLALHGDNDPYGSWRHPEMITQLASGETRMEIIADSQHLPHQEQQSAVIDRIEEFLSSLN